MNSLKYWKEMVGNNYDKIKKFTRINDLLTYACHEFNNDTAVSWDNGKKSYHSFNYDIPKMRMVLARAGVKKGINVGMIFKNDYDFVQTFLAITTLGAVAVIMPPTLSSDAISASVKKFDIQVFTYGKGLSIDINKTKIKDVRYVACYDLDKLRGGVPANDSVKPTDPAVIIFTGGTTGIPKGAVLSHQALLRGSYNGCFIEGQVFRNKYLVLVPFYHVFGLVRNLLTAINTGSELYLVNDTMKFIKEIRNAKPNVMVLVPALANLIYSLVVQGGKEAVGGQLDRIICGGAHTTTETIKRLESVGIKLCPGYGLTETANLVSGSINTKDKPDSVGIVYPEQEVKIVNGEIYVKGDNLFSGYYKDIDETKRVMSEDGYLKTGDLGRFDEDGFLYILGRSKNIIVLDNGENVSPEIIEDALDNIPIINSSLVYEDHNTQGLGIIAAKIYPNYSVLMKLGYNDINKAINDAVSKINEKMPQHMKIAKITILKEDFKRSGSMKIIRKANI